LRKNSNLFPLNAMPRMNGVTRLADSTRASLHRWWPGIAVATLLGAAGCAAPLAERPITHPVHLTEMRFVPERGRVGCAISLTIRFEDPAADVVVAKAHWRLEQSSTMVGSRNVTLPIKPDRLAGRRSGEATAEIRPDRPGTYWYSVQLEDIEGNRSNVLQETISVDGWLPWEERSC
jgi:hypothetical protein